MNADARARPDRVFNLHDDARGIGTGNSGATALDTVGPPREEYRQAGQGFGLRV